jgi:hypothetical protein
MSSVVVLLSGYRRVGKDTLANAMVKHKSFLVPGYNYRFNRPLPNISGDFLRLAFADELKLQVHQRLGIKHTLEETEKIKDLPMFNGRSLRDFYIEHGKAMRDLNPNYWVDIIYQRILPDHNYVISDWRFPTEHKRLVELGVNTITLRLHRSGVDIPPLNVESEHALDNYDFDVIVDAVPMSLR